MGKRIDPKLRIQQRTIGFKNYHFDFFYKHPDFKPDKYCRMAVDEQIKIIDPDFLPNDEKTEPQGERTDQEGNLE